MYVCMYVCRPIPGDAQDVLNDDIVKEKDSLKAAVAALDKVFKYYLQSRVFFGIIFQNVQLNW